MAKYKIRTVESDQKLTVKTVLDLEHKWGLIASDGSIVQFHKMNNPAPQPGDKCRLYKRSDEMAGLFLEQASGEIYDIATDNLKLVVREAQIESLSAERRSFGTFGFFQRHA
jgi:hypothetical protein